ncbi:hypothetical protein N2152v2_006486 [Parachlorella kessleri]
MSRLSHNNHRAQQDFQQESGSPGASGEDHGNNDQALQDSQQESGSPGASGEDHGENAGNDRAQQDSQQESGSPGAAGEDHGVCAYLEAYAGLTLADLCEVLGLHPGAIQCGRYYAGDIARYALPWLLPAAWLQPGSFPLMLYTAFYTVIFVRLAVHVTGRCQVEAWALAVIRLIYEEAKGPFVITIPSQVLALAWRPASVVILRMRHSWSSVRLYATAGARWLEPPAVTALATMHMVLSQATGMGRAYLAPLVVAYTERRRKRQQHQQQRQRRRRTCKAPQLDDGLLSPRSGRASGRATPAREASSHPARFMEASKKMQDSKVAWQRSTSKHAQQLEDLPSPAAAAAPTISTAAMPETPASREVGRTRASNAALPSANQAAAPASVKGQKRYSRHSVDPAHDHRSSSGGSSAHGSPPAGHLPSIASSAVSITHPAGVLPVAATFTASKPPGEHPIVVQGQSKQWQQPRQRQLPSQLEGAGTPEQVVRQRKRQASVDSEAEGSRSTQAAPEPAAASAGVASSVGTPADLPDPMSFPQLNSGLKQIGKNINREAPVDRAAASSRTTQTAPKPRSASASPGVASLAGAPVHLSHPKASEVDSAWTPFTSLSPAWVPTPDQKPQAPSANIQPAGSSEGDECVYCTERPPAALCIPCGHLAFCEPCAQLLYRRGRTACELCRVELEGWVGGNNDQAQQDSQQESGSPGASGEDHGIRPRLEAAAGLTVAGICEQLGMQPALLGYILRSYRAAVFPFLRQSLLSSVFLLAAAVLGLLDDLPSPAAAGAQSVSIAMEPETSASQQAKRTQEFYAALPPAINTPAPDGQSRQRRHSRRSAGPPRDPSSSSGGGRTPNSPNVVRPPMEDSARDPSLPLPRAWVPTPDQRSQAASVGIQPAVCIPCGHLAFCEPCAQLLYRRGRTACELCRMELEGWWGPTMGELAVGPAAASTPASAPSTV